MPGFSTFVIPCHTASDHFVTFISDRLNLWNLYKNVTHKIAFYGQFTIGPVRATSYPEVFYHVVSRSCQYFFRRNRVERAAEF